MKALRKIEPFDLPIDEREKKHKLGSLSLTSVDRWYDSPLITIGGRTITRRDLIRSGCGNMRSINRLVRFIRSRKITSARDLYAVDPVHCVNRVSGFGVFTAFAGMHLLHILGVDPSKWGERKRLRIVRGGRK